MKKHTYTFYNDIWEQICPFFKPFQNSLWNLKRVQTKFVWKTIVGINFLKKAKNVYESQWFFCFSVVKENWQCETSFKVNIYTMFLNLLFPHLSFTCSNAIKTWYHFLARKFMLWILKK